MTHDMNRAAEWRKGASTTGRLKEAIKIYLHCIDQGCARAYYELGGLYSTGEGVEANKQKALEYCKKAGEMGFAEANMALARAFLGGSWDSDMLLPELSKWWRKAADQGSMWAQCNLGCSYHTGEGVKQDFFEAVTWCRKAADQGLAIAQFNLGSAYYGGIGVDQDFTKADELYRLAANQGCEEAKLALARVFTR